MSKTYVMIPTYNEKGNIARLIDAILALNVPGEELHALVVDDNSPDGTSQIVDRMRAGNPRVHLLTRFKRRGRGFAGTDGMCLAVKEGADYVIEMDADFSHDPKYIPTMIAEAKKGYDIVVGSRFVPGGSDIDRGIVRKVITKCAGIYIRLMLGLQVRDVSSGYRCFTRRALEKIDVENLTAIGPGILQEMLYKAIRKGLKVTETPIVFVDRTEGVTKLDWITLAEVLLNVLRLRDLGKKGRLN